MNRSLIWNPLLGKPRYQHRARLNSAHPLNQKMLGWWLLNEGGGTRYEEYVEYRKATGEYSTSIDPVWIVGPYGHALDFSGTRTWARVYGSAGKSYCVGTIFSVHFYINFDGNGQYSILGMDNGGGNNLKWMVVLNAIAANNLSFHYQNPAGTGYNINWPWIPTVGVWYSVLITRLDNAWKLYVDGLQVDTTKTGAVACPTVNTDLHIGTEGENWKYLDGKISEVAIWSRCLEDCDAIELYNHPYYAYNSPRLIVEPRNTWLVLGAEATTLPPTTLPPTTVTPTTVPTTLPSTTLAPTTLPTTAPPTTVVSTTLSPTTLAPTTLPSTAPPTTLAPTTLAPTTIVSPTTTQPTTLPPTTLLPPTTVASTAVPTTLAPTTGVPCDFLIEWDPVAGADGYKVYFGNAPGVYNGPGSPIDVGNVVQYLLTVPSGTWYVAVTAYNEEGESGYSNELTLHCGTTSAPPTTVSPTTLPTTAPPTTVLPTTVLTTPTPTTVLSTPPPTTVPPSTLAPTTTFTTVGPTTLWTPTTVASTTPAPPEPDLCTKNLDSPITTILALSSPITKEINLDGNLCW